MAIEETLNELVKGQARTEQWQSDFDRRIDEKFAGVYRRQDTTNGNVGRHDAEIRQLQTSDSEAKHVHAALLETINALLPRLVEIEAANASRSKGDAARDAAVAERTRILKGTKEWVPFLLNQGFKIALLVAFVCGGVVTWGDEVREMLGL